MATTTSTIGSGGTYATLAAWQTARATASGSGDIERAEILDGTYNMEVELTGWSAGVEIQIAGRNSHGGDPSSGAILARSSSSINAAIQIDTNNTVTIEDIVFDGAPDTSDEGIRIVGADRTISVNVKRCIFTGFTTSQQDGIYIGQPDQNNDVANTTLLVESCLFLNCERGGIHIQNFTGGRIVEATVTVRGCTFRSTIGNALVTQLTEDFSVATVNFERCIILTNGNLWLNNGGPGSLTLNSTNCIFSDNQGYVEGVFDTFVNPEYNATESFVGSLTSGTVQFQSTSDFHLVEDYTNNLALTHNLLTAPVDEQDWERQLRLDPASVGADDFGELVDLNNITVPVSTVSGEYRVGVDTTASGNAILPSVFAETVFMTGYVTELPFIFRDVWITPDRAEYGYTGYDVSISTEVGNAANTIGVGGDFATLAAWQTARIPQSVEGVTETALLLPQVHDMEVTLAGWPESTPIIIGATESHSGVLGAGATIARTTSSIEAAIKIDMSNPVTVRDITFSGAPDESDEAIRLVGLDGRTTTLDVDSCIFTDFVGTNQDAIYIDQPDSGIAAANVTVHNCLFLACDRAAIHAQNFSLGTAIDASIFIAGCTFDTAPGVPFRAELDSPGTVISLTAFGCIAIADRFIIRAGSAGLTQAVVYDSVFTCDLSTVQADFNAAVGNVLTSQTVSYDSDPTENTIQFISPTNYRLRDDILDNQAVGFVTTLNNNLIFPVSDWKGLTRVYPYDCGCDESAKTPAFVEPPNNLEAVIRNVVIR